MNTALRVFISFASQDQEWLQALEVHLATLIRDGILAPWHPLKILPGQDRAAERRRELESAEMILLLVSPSFLASDDCQNHDLPRALSREREGAAVVVPIVIRPCDWTSTPIDNREPLPQGGRAISQWSNLDEAWTDVTAGLRRRIAAMKNPSNAARTETPAPRIFSVPYPRNPFFTGREDVLAKLADQLQKGGRAALSQVAAISGLGGIGKTQTAVEFAYRHRDDYRAVFFVRSETESEIVADFAAMSAKLRLPQAADQNANAQAARRWLEENEGWLLILDNADTPALLEPFLPKEGRGHVLITSRARNFAALHLKSPLRLSSPSEAEALAFLLERTDRIDASEAERRAAAELAAELGNLPLALEQAAAYVASREASFAAYLESYRRRGLELLAASAPETGTGHQAVAVTWSLNIEQVERESPASADLLHAAAYCAPDSIPDELFLEGGGKISERLGKAIATGDPLTVTELAEPLLRYSLVERDAEGGTLSLHRLVQEVVRRNLGEAAPHVVQGLVTALSHVFPWPEFETWPRCERLTSHILMAAKRADDSYDLSRLLNAIATYFWWRGRFAEAVPLYERSLKMREKALGGDHPEVGTSLNNLALLYVDQGRHQEAEPLYERALAIREKSLGTEHPDVAKSLNNLAILYVDQGRYSEAEPLYQRSLAIRELALGGSHPDVATSLNNLANLYADQGRHLEAEPLYERSLAIAERSLGSEHPDVAGSLNNLAVLYVDQGRLSAAEPLYARSLAIREKALGGDHPDVASSLNNLAELCRYQGRYLEAELLHERSLAIRQRSLGADHPDVAESLNNLALLYLYQRRHSEAEVFHERSLAIRKHSLGENHLLVAESLHNLAELYLGQGRYADTEPLFERALTIWEETLGGEHPNVAKVLENLANLRRDQGREAEAEELEARARDVRARHAARNPARDQAK